MKYRIDERTGVIGLYINPDGASDGELLTALGRCREEAATAQRTSTRSLMICASEGTSVLSQYTFKCRTGLHGEQRQKTDQCHEKTRHTPHGSG
jgi:hypothetical protein